jgi:hypothetical protein
LIISEKKDKEAVRAYDMATVCAVILLPLLITVQHLVAADVFCDNLKVVAAMLPKNTSSSPLRFATATFGQAPEVVYALALCRGDVVNGTTCADCIACGFNILQELTPPPQQCAYPDAYYGECHLAYSTDNILGLSYNATGDDVVELQLWNIMNFTSDARLMAGLVKELLVETVEMAASANSRRFATGLTYGGSTFPIVRSLAQCTPDMSAGDCLACLRHLLAKVNSTMALRIGGQIHVIHCYFRYETYAFYNGPPMLRLGQAPTRAPSPDSTPSKNKSKSASALVHPCFLWHCESLLWSSHLLCIRAHEQAVDNSYSFTFSSGSRISQFHLLLSWAHKSNNRYVTLFLKQYVPSY